MRLLAFSDLHRDRQRAEQLLQMAEEADVIVGAGDFATMRLGLEDTIAALSAIAKPAVLVVCGHVHQCWGREATIGTTPVVNVGPAGRFFDI